MNVGDYEGDFLSTYEALQSLFLSHNLGEMNENGIVIVEPRFLVDKFERAIGKLHDRKEQFKKFVANERSMRELKGVSGDLSGSYNYLSAEIDEERLVIENLISTMKGLRVEIAEVANWEQGSLLLPKIHSFIEMVNDETRDACSWINVMNHESDQREILKSFCTSSVATKLFKLFDSDGQLCKDGVDESVGTSEVTDGKETMSNAIQTESHETASNESQTETQEPVPNTDEIAVFEASSNYSFEYSSTDLSYDAVMVDQDSDHEDDYDHVEEIGTMHKEMQSVMEPFYKVAHAVNWLLDSEISQSSSVGDMDMFGLEDLPLDREASKSNDYYSESSGIVSDETCEPAPVPIECLSAWFEFVANMTRDDWLLKPNYTKPSQPTSINLSMDETSKDGPKDNVKALADRLSFVIAKYDSRLNQPIMALSTGIQQVTNGLESLGRSGFCLALNTNCATYTCKFCNGNILALVPKGEEQKFKFWHLREGEEPEMRCIADSMLGGRVRYPFVEGFGSGF